MPSRYISRDGEILADRFTDGPYIFQNVHTLGGAARHTAAHTALLRAAAKSLFGFDPEITADELRRRIARLTEACRMPSRVSVRAVVRLYPTGSIEIACDEPSIYAGYVLRSLRPDAICLRMAPPLPSLPTSAAEHTRLLADTMAHTRGARTAILTDSDGTVSARSLTHDRPDVCREAHHARHAGRRRRDLHGRPPRHNIHSSYRTQTLHVDHSRARSLTYRKCNSLRGRTTTISVMRCTASKNFIPLPRAAHCYIRPTPRQ